MILAGLLLGGCTTSPLGVLVNGGIINGDVHYTKVGSSSCYKVFGFKFKGVCTTDEAAKAGGGMRYVSLVELKSSEYLFGVFKIDTITVKGN